MKLHVSLPKTPKTELQLMLDDLEIYMNSTVKLNESVAPRCPCCGTIENLRSGYSGGNLIWLCPDAAREMEYER